MGIVYKFGTDGIRSKHPFINEIIGFLLAKSFTKTVNTIDKVVIGYDSRFSSYPISLAIASALISEGIKVELSDNYVSTPTLAFITKIKKCYGFQITASHNPYNYNGIKILKNGLKIENILEKKIEEELNNKISNLEQRFSNYLEIFNQKEPGKFKVSNFIKVYLQNLEKYIKNYISSLKEWDILLDTANGSLSKYAKIIFKKLSAKTEVINNNPNGFNINYKCGSTHLEEFKNQYSAFAKKHPNSIGITFDGDGDRVIALIKVNKTIYTIYGDIMLYFITKYLKNIIKSNVKAVALTQMSSLGIENSFKKLQVSVVRTEVGDKYITDSIINNQADLGAEPSGHIVIPPFLYTGDGLLSSLFFLASIKHLDIINTLNEIEHYHQKIINIKVNNKNNFIQINQKLFDKIQKWYKNSRIYVRPSGTEEVVRILIESQELKIIEEIERLINQEVIINV
jgi:phosphoglucosamine mutase